MSRQPDPPSDTHDDAAPDPDQTIRPEDVHAYLAEHPEIPAGIDVTRIIAAEKARRLRPDLNDEAFDVLIGPALATVSGHPATTVEEILAYLAAVRPPPPKPRRWGRPRLCEEDRRREIVKVMAELRAAGEERPTREKIAERLGIESITLRRWLVRFPDLRALLPSSGHPNRS